MSATATETFLQYSVQQQLKPQGIQGLSEKLLDQHWKLYEGYVTNTNLLNKSIWEALDSSEINKPVNAELQRRFGFEYNGMVLHEYYFGSMKSGVDAPSATSEVGKKLAADFGTIDRWKKHFTEIGKMRGIGWVISFFDPMAKRLVNTWVGDHEIGNLAGFIPVVVMDMWEHAYVTDYGATAAGRGEYIQTYFANLNWDVIGKRLDAAQRGLIIPRA